MRMIESGENIQSMQRRWEDWKTGRKYSGAWNRVTSPRPEQQQDPPTHFRDPVTNRNFPDVNILYMNKKK